MVDNSELTTISDLTPLAIYTIRVQAFTSMGAGECRTFLSHIANSVHSLQRILNIC